jgi:geranylgeranyl pyrophosphate synthase
MIHHAVKPSPLPTVRPRASVAAKAESNGWRGLPQALGLAGELHRLRSVLSGWIEKSDPEMREALRWQLGDASKFFRPLTIFACYRAAFDRPIPPATIQLAAALEIFHNVSLIIDDILDRSRFRRQKLTLHCRYGELRALMTAGYMTAGGFEIVARDAYAVRLLGELMQRLGIAECVQWRLRRHPLGVADWRVIAGEDTGSMFEICARVGTRDRRLAGFGRLLGILYHGCDDVSDVRGGQALGEGGYEDLRDRILTLPAAIAIQRPGVGHLFRTESHGSVKPLRRAFAGALPRAERYLDRLARDASAEARRHAVRPEPLLALIQHTRALSRA